MDITRYVETIRRELTVVAAAGGEEAQALAERMIAPLESAIRLTMLEALSAAAAEITSEMAPGSVHLRLRGQDPDFLVTLAPPPAQESAPAAVAPAAAPDDSATAGGDKGATSRINLRLPDDLKNRIEEAAERERLSVNTWIVRATASALESGRGSSAKTRDDSDSGQRYTGWVR